VKQRFAMRCIQYMNRCISHSTCVLQYPQPEVIPPQRSMLARARACSSFGTVLRQPGSRAAPLLAPVWVDARQRFFSQQFLQLARASRATFSRREGVSVSSPQPHGAGPEGKSSQRHKHHARCAFRRRCGWLWAGSKRLQAPSTARTNLRRVARTAVRKAAAGGRSALALLRAPPRARCTARPL
jgi:hypothetical protein